MHRRFLAALGLPALLLAMPAAVLAADAAAKPAKQAAKHKQTGATQRAVFQVTEDDSRKWNTILANIHNVQEELGKVEITVVAIGPGLGMLKADALTANGVQDAMAAGVRFVACGNTMKSLNLGKDDMIDGIDYARAGYVEVMHLQQQGYVYLRP